MAGRKRRSPNHEPGVPPEPEPTEPLPGPGIPPEPEPGPPPGEPQPEPLPQDPGNRSQAGPGGSLTQGTSVPRRPVLQLKPSRRLKSSSLGSDGSQRRGAPHGLRRGSGAAAQPGGVPARGPRATRPAPGAARERPGGTSSGAGGRR